jgi:hypothetical protein
VCVDACVVMCVWLCLCLYVCLTSLPPLPAVHGEELPLGHRQQAAWTILELIRGTVSAQPGGGGTGGLIRDLSTVEHVLPAAGMLVMFGWCGACKHTHTHSLRRLNCFVFTFFFFFFFRLRLRLHMHVTSQNCTTSTMLHSHSQINNDAHDARQRTSSVSPASPSSLSPVVHSITPQFPLLPDSMESSLQKGWFRSFSAHLIMDSLSPRLSLELS